MMFSEYNRHKAFFEGMAFPSTITNMVFTRSFIMSHAAGIAHRHHGSVLNFFYLSLQKAGSLITAFIKHRALARAEMELDGLSDKMLADIGVRRNDIHNVVRTGKPSF